MMVNILRIFLNFHAIMEDINQKRRGHMSKFKFIHVGDTHLGYSGNSSRYNEFSALRVLKTTPEGINVRQNDVYKAFEQVIDLAVEHQVDAVLHAGDSWDHWGYKQPYVQNEYTKQVARLIHAGIDYVEIIGNHDLPKIAGKGCHLETLSRFPGVHCVYQGFYQQVNLEKHGVVIHGVPSTFTQEILDDSLSQVARVPGKINIGMGHFGVTAIKHYAENAVNSLVVDLDRLVKANMDYFALADYHTPTDFGNNIRYCGSIERFGFDEMGNTPQVLLVEVDSETKEVTVTEIPLQVREMMELTSINAENKTPEEINHAIIERIQKADLTDKIVRLRVKNMPNHIKSAINDEKIKELTEASLYFRLEFVDKTETSKGVKSSGTKFEGVYEGWSSFIAALPEDGSFDKKEIEKRGAQKLLEALENAIS